MKTVGERRHMQQVTPCNSRTGKYIQTKHTLEADRSWENGEQLHEHSFLAGSGKNILELERW